MTSFCSDLRTEGHKRSMRSAEARIQRTMNWIDRYKKQLDKMEVKANVEGMVTYGNPHDVRDETEVKIGKTYNQGQILITIPALSDMFTDLKIHEELRPMYDPGTKVLGTFKAIPGIVIKGTITKVDSLAQPKFRKDPTSPKIFFVRVKFDLEQEGMDKVIAGMTVECELLCKEMKSVLSVPMDSVFEESGKVFVRVKKGKGFEKRQITPTDFNEISVAFSGNVKAGEKVLLFDPGLEIKTP